MNKLILVLILMLSSNASFSQVQKMGQVSDNEIKRAEFRKLNGVKKITTFEYFEDSLSSRDSENFKVIYIHEFDKNGDEVNVYSVAEDSSIYLSAEYRYDNKHRRIFAQTFYEDGEKDSQYKAVFNDSMIISERRILNSMSHDSSYYSYNTNGSQKFKIIYKNGIVKDSIAYSNDINGKRILSQSFTTRKLNYYIKYEYLTDKDYVERIFEKDNTLRLKRYWKYDEKNNLLDSVEFDENEVISTWYSYSYNCDGKETKGRVYKTSKKILSFRNECIYKAGKLHKVLNFGSDNKLTSSNHYNYDSHGMNTIWINKKYINDKAQISFIYKMAIDYKN